MERKTAQKMTDVPRVRPLLSDSRDLRTNVMKDDANKSEAIGVMFVMLATNYPAD